MVEYHPQKLRQALRFVTVTMSNKKSQSEKEKDDLLQQQAEDVDVVDKDDADKDDTGKVIVDKDEEGKLTDPENVGKLMTALRMIKKLHPLQNKITIA